MNPAPDLFAAFVGSVADHLDDHEVRAEDLAARLHLSRFHFDRIIAATAGETPTQFRRRVLLERAAYQLSHGTALVIDIAVGAGYSSHEAFTRAFQKAYGVSPSAWRAAPRPTRLPTPNHVHFYPPGGLRLPSETKVNSMDLMVSMVDHHVWLVGQMLDQARTLTDAQLDQPIVVSVEGVDDDPTLRSLLARLVGQLDMWNSSLANEPYDLAIEANQPISTLRDRLDIAGPTFATNVRDIAGRDGFGDTFVDATCEPPRVFTYGGMVAHVLTFAAHRRTIVVGAFASFGNETLGWGDPMDWVAAS